MELVEKKYRDTPEGHKKYAKRLTDYLSSLVLKERFLEAMHLFDHLYKVKPNHAKTIRLGYALSISLFDKEGVRKFDKLLYDSKPSENELTWFRLKYYYSVNDRKNIEECCELLLANRLNDKQLDTVIEICLTKKSYEISADLIKYLNRENLRLSDSGSKRIRNTIIQKLTESIYKVKNA